MEVDREYEALLQEGLSKEVLDEPYGAEPPSSRDQAAKDSVALLDDQLTTMAEDDINGVMQKLGKFSAESDLDKALLAGIPGADVVGALKQRWDNPDSDASVAGAVAAVAGPEESPDITAEGFKVERLKTKRKMAEDLYKVGYANRAEQALGFVETFGRFMNPIPVFEGDRVASKLAEAFPFVAGEVYTNIGVAFQMIRDKVMDDSTSVEEAGLMMSTLAGISYEVSNNGYYSKSQDSFIMLQMLHPMVEYDPEKKYDNALTVGLDAGGQILDRIPFFSPTKAFKSLAQQAVLARLSIKAAGFLKGTYNYAISQTAEGVTRMSELVRGRASDTAVREVRNAPRTEDIIDSIAMPKVDGLDIDKAPYIYANLVSDAKKAELLADPAYVYGAAGVKRINASATNGGAGVVSKEVLDGGITMTAQFGTKNGYAYKNATVAARANARDFGGQGTVVQSGSGWFVNVPRMREFGIDDAADKALDLGHRSTRFTAWVQSGFGNLLRGSGAGNSSANIAARESQKAATALTQTMKPYLDLPHKSKHAVNAALDSGDKNKQVWNLGQLRGGFGLNDKEILAYASVRRVADTEWKLKDIRMRANADAAGWRALNLPNSSVGLKILADVNDAVLTSPGMTLKTIRAVDQATGAITTLDTVSPLKVVARLMVPTKNGERYMLIDKSMLKHVGNLPSSILPMAKGYLPRAYKYPHYVKVFKGGVAQETLRPARSQLEADELVDELRLANPGEDIRSVPAQEFRILTDEAELEALDQAGLLWSSARGPSRLFDAAGDVRMPTVEDRLREMIDDGAMAAGLQKWGDVQKKAWNNKFGSLFEGPFTPGQTGLLAAKGASDARAVAHALHEAKFISNALGVGEGATQSTVRTIGQGIAESLYNTATRADWLANKMRGDKKGSRLGTDIRDIADNFMGASGRILSNAKTVPYLLYLAGNPIRQFPLQMTLIPSYFGVNGAAKYALGGFQRDFSILMASGLTEQGAKLAGKLGSDAELVEQFRRSGVSASLEHHTQVATIGTSGVTSSSTRFGSFVDNTTKALTNVGIGAGIRVEKVSAWLIARNRWKVVNPGKAITKEDERSIAAFAEELSLNPNRTDTLPIQHGLLGFFTQFLSMQVKQMGRTFQALPGVPAGSISKKELRRMAFLNFAMYGTVGYGAKTLSDKILAAPELDVLNDELREMVADGISNYVLDATLTAASGEESDTAFSESFSPNSQLGGTLGLVKALSDGVTMGDYDTLANMRWQAPGLGVVHQVAEALSFSAAIIGAPALPTPESDAVKLSAITTKVMKLAPALNNWMKAQAALELRAKFNSRGDPTVEAAWGEALVALAGVQTKEEARMWELNSLLTNRNLDTDVQLASVRDAAYETSKWMLPLLDEMVEGKVTYKEALTYIDSANMFFTTTLPPEYHAEYVKALRETVDKRWALKYETILEKILDEAGTGKLPISSDAIYEVAMRIPDPVKRQQVVDYLNRKLFGASNGKSS